jgi:hypothetical protein
MFKNNREEWPEVRADLVILHDMITSTPGPTLLFRMSPEEQLNTIPQAWPHKFGQGEHGRMMNQFVGVLSCGLYQITSLLGFLGLLAVVFDASEGVATRCVTGTFPVTMERARWLTRSLNNVSSWLLGKWICSMERGIMAHNDT